MSAVKIDMNMKPGQLIISTRMKIFYSVCMFVGFCVFAVGLNVDKERMWASYLTSFFFFVSMALAGMFFTAIQHVTNAGWSVNVRRFSESLTAFLPMGFVMAIIFIAFGASHLYEWLDPAKVQADALLAKKVGYLNNTFFVIRMVLFFGLWIFFWKKIIHTSVKQDETGDESITLKLVPKSVAFILVFALSYSFFSIDTLMSLDPHWFSTMFGVYTFAGLFQAGLAVIILVTLWVRNKGLVQGFVKADHLHDLGKFLKAFTIFMAYIGFSQFMLIWYANMPEETEFFLHRSHAGWMTVSLSLLVFKFIVPLLMLLPMSNKRSPTVLAMVSILIVVMEYVDIYWLVYPNLNHNHPIFGVWEIGVFLGFLGIFMFTATKFLAKNSLIPMRDPRRHESMAHHVTY